MAGDLQLTTYPNALINAFRQNGHEEVRSYVFRKQQEGLTIMLEGSHNLEEMLEVVVRGIKEEEAVKHRLVEKLEEGEISNFKQLRRLVNSEILKHKGVSGNQPTEQINYATGSFKTPDHSLQQRQPDRRPCTLREPH